MNLSSVRRKRFPWCHYTIAPSRGSIRKFALVARGTLRSAINEWIIGDNMTITTQLKALKDKKQMTNQQLSDLSGVPVGTINRILSGQTENPSFQTVCDLVVTLGGSLDELAGVRLGDGEAEHPGAPTEATVRLYEQVICSKDTWMHRLFVVCCILMAFILCVLVFDLANPTVGFFQR